MWLGEMYHEAREEACQHENMKICLQDDNERLRAEVSQLKKTIKGLRAQTTRLMCDQQEEQSDE